MLNHFPRLAALMRLLVAFVPLSVAAAQAPASWTPVGGASIGDLAVNPRGVMWAIQFDRTASPDKPVLKWNGTDFVALPATAVRIAVDPQGNPWTVSSTGVLATLGSGSATWTEVPIKAADVGVGADGSVWVISPDQSIHRLVKGAWQQVSGAAVRIAVDPKGNAWVVNGAGQIWRFDGAAFQPVPGTARDVAISADGSVFVVSTKALTGGFEILQWNGNGWTPVPGAGGVVIAAGDKLYIGLHGSDGTKLYATNYVPTNTTPSNTTPSAGVVTVSVPVITKPASGPTTTSTAQPATPPTSQPTTILVQGTTSIAVGGTPTTAKAPGDAGPSLVVLGAPKVTSMEPIEGQLVCPIIAEHNQLTKGCALIGEPALYLSKAPSTTCANGTFGDPENGGECWTCPAGYVRNVSPVFSKDACWKPVSENLSKATQVGKIGCKDGFFNDPIYGCYQCPSGYYRTLDNVTWGTACAKAIVGPFSFAKSGGKPTLACPSPSFFDPINGGTCWTCPNNYRRTLNSVTSDGACAQTMDTQYSFATQKSGCSMTSRVGYGTAFRDPRNGGECWVCPLPLLRAGGSPVNSPDHGVTAACNAGGNTNRLVWQLSQYPEPGAYPFMPGLLEMAFSNPKLVDAFVAKRAGNDPAKKRAIWNSMVADPGSSAEVKALVFTALLNAAKQPRASLPAQMSVAAFEKYALARRIFVAEEAERMFTAWQGVDGYNSWNAARNSLGIGGMQQISSDVLGKAGGDYKAYAWSGAAPDSAGLEFIAAAAALTGVAPSATGTTLNTTNVLPFTTEEYLEPVFNSLDKGFEVMGEAGESMASEAMTFSALEAGEMIANTAKGAGVVLILVESGIKLGITIKDYIEKEDQAAEYAKIVEEARQPLSVKAMLASSDDDDRRSLLLFWSLATSPHSANANLTKGLISGAALCQRDEWMKQECSQAKGVVAAAMKSAGY
jgi:hypothetical protein